MSDTPFTFLVAHLPDAFARAMERLREHADDGKGWAQSRLSDAEGAHGAVAIVLEGEGGERINLVIERAALSVVAEVPEGVAVQAVIAAPAEAAQQGLAMLMASGFDLAKVSTRLTSIASAKAARLLATQPTSFAVELNGLPVVGDLKLRVGLGMAEPPDAPSFTVVTSYADILSAREQKLAPPQMLIAGKLKILGDSVKAMQLGMLVMQLR